MTFAQLLGDNVRRLREDIPVSQSGLSRALTDLGVRWAPSRVSQLEAGEVAATMSTVILLAAALGRLRGYPVALAELLRTEDTVEVATGLFVPGGVVNDILTGRGAEALYDERLAENPGDAALDDRPPDPRFAGMSPAEIEAWLRCNRVDERAARALGLTRRELVRLAVRAWGRGFSAERDRRASAEGRVTQAEMTALTRSLRSELEAVRGTVTDEA